MIIPVYLSLVVKDITNIVLSAGKIDFNYTLKVRIAKTGLDEKAIQTISKGLNIRINNILVPLKPGNGAVVLLNYPDSTFIKYTVRKLMSASYRVDLR
jgi:hypothetical protein